MSGASERANGRASGPVLTSGFLIDMDHCGLDRHCSGLQLNVYLIPRGTEEKMKEKTRPDAINSVSFCLSISFTLFLFA